MSICRSERSEAKQNAANDWLTVSEIARDPSTPLRFAQNDKEKKD